MLLLMLAVKKLVGPFTEKNSKKIKKSLELKKQLRNKLINYITNGKATIIILIVWSIKKIFLYKISYMEIYS